MPSNSMDIFKDKSILITGGTGSFGRAMTEKLLRDSKCHKVIIFSRDEWKQWEMRQSDPLFNDPECVISWVTSAMPTASREHFLKSILLYMPAALKTGSAAEYQSTDR